MSFLCKIGFWPSYFMCHQELLTVVVSTAIIKLLLSTRYELETLLTKSVICHWLCFLLRIACFLDTARDSVRHTSLSSARPRLSWNYKWKWEWLLKICITSKEVIFLMNNGTCIMKNMGKHNKLLNTEFDTNPFKFTQTSFKKSLILLDNTFTYKIPIIIWYVSSFSTLNN